MILGIIGNDSPICHIRFCHDVLTERCRGYYVSAQMQFSGGTLVYVLPILFLCLRKLKRM